VSQPGPPKLWGGRFSKPTARRVEEFTSSLPVDRRLLWEDVAGSVAHARMLGRQRIIPSDDARAIVSGLVQLAAELAADDLSGETRWEDVHSLVEGRLREKIGPAAGRLHTARSRNDQVALDERLFARRALADGAARILDLQEVLLELARRHAEVVLPGYTHLQRAQPVLLAHHLLAYVEMLARDLGRLRDAYARADVMPLGSGALAGAPYPLDREYVARLLGFSAISLNSLDAVGYRDFLVEHLAALALVAVHLSRLAEELVLWSGAEFGFVEIDDGYATGSSIMPQKKNPDVAELVRGKTGRVVGHLVALLTTLKGLPLAYNRDLQEDKQGYFDAVDTTHACLELATGLVQTLRVRAERMESAAEGGFATATDLADHLVRRGLPFRDAHQVAGAIVRACEASGPFDVGQ
jgi:argininosuccinate lyase